MVHQLELDYPTEIFFKYPLPCNHCACVLVYLQATSALLSDITFHGWIRIKSPTRIHTLFLSLPGILAILSFPSLHWTLSLSEPSICSITAKISPSLGVLILAISSSGVSCSLLYARSSSPITYNNFGLNTNNYVNLGFKTRS